METLMDSLTIDTGLITGQGFVLKKREIDPSVFGLEDKDIAACGKVGLEGRITKAQEGFVFEGRVAACLELICGRCLKRFPREVESEFNAYFLPEPEHDSEEHEVELTSEELDSYFFEGNEIDLLRPARDVILLAVPIKPLCDPECVGLCPVCGKNLKKEQCNCPPDDDVDPRLAVLKNLLKKE